MRLIELLHQPVCQLLFIRSINLGHLDDRLFVAFAAGLHQAGCKPQTRQQLRSTGLHVVDDDVMVGGIQRRDVDVKTPGVAPPQLRNQPLDLHRSVGFLGVTGLARLAQVDVLALGRSGSAYQRDPVGRRLQRLMLARPGLDFLAVVGAQPFFGVSDLAASSASTTFAGSAASCSRLDSRGCTGGCPSWAGRSDGNAIVTRVSAASSLASR